MDGEAITRRRFAEKAKRCYNITMIDPLSPLAGLRSRLVLALALVAVLWLGVAWALIP